MKMFPIIMTDEESLQTFTIEKGVEFKIELSEAYSAGYLWTAPAFDNTILHLRSNEPINDGKPFDINTSSIGGKGKRRFIFETHQSGLSTIFMSLKRPFEKNVLPIEVFSVSIRVI